MANPTFQLKDNLVILSTRNLLSGEESMYVFKKDSISGIKVVSSRIYVLGNFNDKIELQFINQAGIAAFMTSFLRDVLGIRPVGANGGDPGPVPGGPGGGGGAGGGRPSGDPTRKNRRTRRI
jgi:hypothetical protein